MCSDVAVFCVPNAGIKVCSHDLRSVTHEVAFRDTKEGERSPACIGAKNFGQREMYLSHGSYFLLGLACIFRLKVTPDFAF